MAPLVAILKSGDISRPYAYLEEASRRYRMLLKMYNKDDRWSGTGTLLEVPGQR